MPFDLLIRGVRVVIDATGHVVAPGFVDPHGRERPGWLLRRGA